MKDKGFWATLLVLSLALCTWGYFHPYARLGFSLLPVILCANYKVLLTSYHNWKAWHPDIPKWILMPWAILLISSVGHLLVRHSLNDVMGVLLIFLLLGAYLLAREMVQELKVRLAWLAILGSIGIIVNRTYDATTFFPGFLGIFHYAAFALLIGLVLAPRNMRFWTALFVLPALLVSGSEEGIVALILIGLYCLLTRKTTRQILVPLGATCLVAIPLLATGWLEEVYPRLDSTRLQLDMQTLSHGRWDAYVGLTMQPEIWVLGNGWYWVNVGSAEADSWVKTHPGVQLWQTVHNAPMRIAAQFGILAALSWLFLMLTALWKSKYKTVFLIILCFAFMDNLLWTGAIAWPFVLLGMCYPSKQTWAPVYYEGHGGSQ